MDTLYVNRIDNYEVLLIDTLNHTQQVFFNGVDVDTNLLFVAMIAIFLGGILGILLIGVNRL